MNDKNGEVRKEFVHFTQNLLTNFNIIYLKKFEPNLVIFLLNGMADSIEEIATLSMNKLDEAGIYRKVIKKMILNVLNITIEITR